MSDDRRLPGLLGFYQHYLDNRDTAVFLGKVSQRYSPGTLERLARHDRREIRRAAVLALGFVGGYETNHTLGCALLDEDRTVRTLAENSIRCVWPRASGEEDRLELNVILRLHAARQYPQAIGRGTQLIEKSPAFAEAWYARAACQLAMDDFAATIRDCHEALEINPYHFIAATTAGRAYLELGNQISALESFRRALRLNPDLEGVRTHVVRLARLVEGKQG